ncbi:hypothetical protein [Azospirillum lipoferum]|uniref:Phosphodiesterase n=1 Tax=Azospirillum lipoferum (strain 4B) TaxID=862719 RepID=G7ZIY1_AZOL4|nr:hypothetical protein [Azospirillum lipoferum]CBS91470.1 conserved protein of unknown function [Azospirillum lipoferum 4B]
MGAVDADGILAASEDMIAILAHRGFWTEPAEKNSREALERAFREGFGIETDIRDRNGALVVSHDPPAGDGLMSFDELLELYGRHAPRADGQGAGGRAGTLALNIKADGLQGPLLDALARHGVDDWFVFDMAVPDGILYLRRGAVAYTRQSEYEREPSFYERAAGVWLDAFESDWIDAAAIERHLAAGKRVALVSPELHGRPHAAAWESWKAVATRAEPGMLALCTDFPDKAREFFDAP